VLDAVKEVASETGTSPAQVALRWAIIIPGLTSVPIFGARFLEQLNNNVAVLDVSLTSEQYKQISDAGRCREISPYIYTD